MARAALGLALLGAAGCIGMAAAGPRGIRLPPETAVLRPASSPGYLIASAKCSLCHSADYVNLQPPGMTFKQWTAEMVKMQHAYGAPIVESEINLLAIYLTSAYGDASTVPADAVPP